MKCLPMPIKRVASRLLDLGRLTWDDLLEVPPAYASRAPAPSAPLAALGALCTLRTLRALIADSLRRCWCCATRPAVLMC